MGGLPPQSHLLLAHLSALMRKDTSDLTALFLEGKLAPFLVQTIDRNIMIIPVEILAPSKKIVRTFALLDSGASVSFISTHLVKTHDLPITDTNSPMIYKLANGIEHQNNSVSTLGLQVSGTHHQELISFRHLPNAAFPIILGNSWLNRHDPVIHWRDGIVGLTCLHDQTSSMRRSDSLILPGPVTAVYPPNANFARAQEVFAEGLHHYHNTKKREREEQEVQ